MRSQFPDNETGMGPVRSLFLFLLVCIFETPDIANELLKERQFPALGWRCSADKIYVFRVLQPVMLDFAYT